MRVANSQNARATLRLDLAREITTLPSGTAATNRVMGQLDTSTAMPTCRDTVGNLGQPLAIKLQNAPGSSLRVDCPGASVLTLENTNGACLQAVMATASTIFASGNRSVVIYPNLQRSTIDVNGMTSWGLPAAPSRSPTNTRVIVRLSQWSGDESSASLKTIQGRLPYVVPQGAFGVIVHGCGASNVKCTVTDKLGKSTCRATDVCIASAATAKANMLAAINDASPCTAPLPGAVG